MPKISFYGICNAYAPYTDFEFHTDDPNRYWVLTYIGDENLWYAFERTADRDDGWFDNEREATKEEVAMLLEAMPVNKLPVGVFYHA
jgi:hypothetical protein